MIRVFKDNDIKVVTNGVYNQLYKPLGYKPIIEEPKPKVVVQKPVDKTDDENKESSKLNRRKRGE